jgi:hypothetical protein
MAGCSERTTLHQGNSRHNDTQNKDTQVKELIYGTQHNPAQPSAIMLTVMLLSLAMLNVIVLNILVGTATTAFSFMVQTRGCGLRADFWRSIVSMNNCFVNHLFAIWSTENATCGLFYKYITILQNDACSIKVS